MNRFGTFVLLIVVSVLSTLVFGGFRQLQVEASFYQTAKTWNIQVSRAAVIEDVHFLHTFLRQVIGLGFDEAAVIKEGIVVVSLPNEVTAPGRCALAPKFSLTHQNLEVGELSACLSFGGAVVRSLKDTATILFATAAAVFLIVVYFLPLFLYRRRLKVLITHYESPGTEVELDPRVKEDPVGQRLFEVLEENHRKRIRAELESQKNSAIASTVQMVAHDVRKPFSTVQVAMSLIEGAESLRELDELIPMIRKSVDGALVSVNGMLSDVMELGKQGAALQRVECSLEELTFDCLREVCQMFEEATVMVERRFNFVDSISIDPLKMKRVFSNILANAVQACHARGKLWILGEAKGKDLDIRFGNSGSYIPESELEMLFEAFYTKGKASGTGLGLAIAKKIVSAHGGFISARSDQTSRIVEFHIHLPNVFSNCLPEKKSFSDLKDLNAFRPVHGVKISQQLSQDMKDLLKAMEGRDPMPVCLLDDEVQYRKLIEDLANEAPLRHMTRVALCATLKDFWSVAMQSFVAIIDIDLELDVDGYMVVRELRDRGYRGTICVHSNRTFASDVQTALDSGADLVFPKPLTREHFVRILLRQTTNCRH